MWNWKNKKNVMLNKIEFKVLLFFGLIMLIITSSNFEYSTTDYLEKGKIKQDSIEEFYIDNNLVIPTNIVIEDFF